MYKGNSYSSEYRKKRSRRSVSPTRLVPARAINTPSAKRTRPNASDQATLEERKKQDDQRVCYCDIYCSVCSSDAACAPIHEGLYCSGPCQRWIHAECAGLNIVNEGGGTFAVSKHADDGIRVPINAESQGENPWLCANYKAEDEKEKRILPFRSLKGSQQKGARLGLKVDSWDVSERQKKRRIDDFIKNMRSVVGDDELVDSILDSEPRPYPSHKPVSPATDEASRLAGRLFECSLLLLRVAGCDCCGKTKPFYDDVKFRKKTKFHRMHLNDPYYDAWHCDCERICRGGQYYCKSSMWQKAWFEEEHGQALEDTFGDPNAILCSDCHKDNLGGNETMILPRPFSIRNGFGPVPKPVPGTQAWRLREMLRALTPSEEAAIRQITPLLSIVRLKHGNIGTKGHTACAWQKSKLSTILPNLPKECRIVTIQRKAQRQTVTIQLKSYEFERRKIVDVLHALHSTNTPPWDKVEISQDAIDQWQRPVTWLPWLFPSTSQKTKGQLPTLTSKATTWWLILGTGVLRHCRTLPNQKSASMGQSPGRLQRTILSLPTKLSTSSTVPSRRFRRTMARQHQLKNQPTELYFNKRKCCLLPTSLI